MRRASALAMLVALTAACSVGGGLSVEPLPEPPPTAATTTPEPAPDLSRVELPTARGRTTTTAVVLGPGPAALQGTVVGPGGPVADAMIRVERLVGDTVVGTDLASVDGTWSLPGVNGGRYRVRAWRAPDLAQVEPAQLFVGARDTAPVELKLERFAGLHAAPVLTPIPPVVDQPVTVVVQITLRSVDVGGIVRAVPVPGARVEVSALTTWMVRSAGVTVTDATGRSRWDLLCRAAGPQMLSVVVNGTTTVPVELPACVDPAPVVPDDPAPAPATPSTTRPPVTTTTKPRP